MRFKNGKLTHNKMVNIANIRKCKLKPQWDATTQTPAWLKKRLKILSVERGCGATGTHP